MLDDKGVETDDQRIIFELFIKSSDQLSNTEALINEVIAYYQDFDIESEIVRVVDYNVA